MQELIYADYNATTPPSAPCLEALKEALEAWGNPSSVHQKGRSARRLLETARENVASACLADPSEVVFTSGGSEANNLALLGSYLENPELRILTSPVEHSSQRDLVGCLERRGARISKFNVDRHGRMDTAEFEGLLDNFKPTLVSIMAANSETGVVFPLPALAKACKARGIPLHTDAVQALGKLHPELWAMADLISISSHKVYGAKGAGALILRKGLKLHPVLYGGSQEKKRRGGTEPTLALAGFGAACKDLPSNDENAQIESLRNRFESKLQSTLEGIAIQGSEAKRVSNTSNIRFAGITSDILLTALDMDGLCVSGGTACSSGSLSPSQVLLAMGYSAEEARECLRFSWGRHTTQAQIDRAADIVISHVQRIRSRKR